MFGSSVAAIELEDWKGGKSRQTVWRQRVRVIEIEQISIKAERVRYVDELIE